MVHKATNEICKRCGNLIVSRADRKEIKFKNCQAEVQINYFCKGVYFGELCSKCAIDILYHCIFTISEDFELEKKKIEASK